MTRSRVFPDRSLERSLAFEWQTVAGMDEVGRGALAGPVAVGVVVVGAEMPPAPHGIADSKLLSHKRRMALVPQIEDWALAHSVGLASPQEIDQFGITAALRMAGMRALSQVGQVGAVLLDGQHNWLRGGSLFDVNELACPVFTEVKADMKSVAVAAASILAKERRDDLMERLPDPGYDWGHNKGYGSAAHREALVKLGPSVHHRKSWKLI